MSINKLMLSKIARQNQALTPEPSVELLVPSDRFRLYITIIHMGISTASMERNLVKRNHTRSLNQFVAPIGDNEDNKGEVGKEELGDGPITSGEYSEAVCEENDDVEEKGDDGEVVLVSTEPRPLIIGYGLGRLGTPKPNIYDVENAVNKQVCRPDNACDPGEDSKRVIRGRHEGDQGDEPDGDDTEGRDASPSKEHKLWSLSIDCQGVQGSSGSEVELQGTRPSRGEKGAVDDVRKDRDVKTSDANDERRSSSAGLVRAQVRVIIRNEDPDCKNTEDIEDSESVDDAAED
jgi:hypothetical protein